MYKYRITKYNPSFRDDNGAYLKDDWTAISDIGRSFDEGKLTPNEYKKNEDAYIIAIHLIMDYLSVPYLIITNVDIPDPTDEIFQKRIKKFREFYTEEMLDYYSKAKNNDKLNKEKVDFHCRFMLREDIYSEVHYPRKMKVFIAYDYLMGIHTSKSLKPIFPLLKKQGLYIEDFTKSS